MGLQIRRRPGPETGDAVGQAVIKSQEATQVCRKQHRASLRKTADAHSLTVKLALIKRRVEEWKLSLHRR
jgi:hypothetical protein